MAKKKIEKKSDGKLQKQLKKYRDDLQAAVNQLATIEQQRLTLQTAIQQYQGAIGALQKLAGENDGDPS